MAETANILNTQAKTMNLRTVNSSRDEWYLPRTKRVRKPRFAPPIPQPFVRLNGYSVCQWNSSRECGQVTKAVGPGNRSVVSYLFSKITGRSSASFQT